MDAPALAHAYDYVILIDFEATSDQDDDSRTRLAQCDVHEIIEWVRKAPQPHRSKI